MGERLRAVCAALITEKYYDDHRPLAPEDTGDGFQGENGRVVILCQVCDDVIMVEGNAMASVYGSSRATDKDGCGYF